MAGTLYTPLTDGQLGRASNINAVLQQLEDAILVGQGLMRTRTAWTTLSAAQPDITINVTPGDNTLMLMATLRSNYGASNYDDVRITFNDDTVNTYSVRYGLVNSGAGGSVAEVSGTSGFTLTQASWGSNSSEAYSFLKMEIPLASSLVSKACMVNTITPAAYSAYVHGGAVYSGAVAITKIKLVPVNGTAWTAGCRYALFGVN